LTDPARTQHGPARSRTRAWKARPGSPLSRDPTPMAQVRLVCDRPLLTVRDRQVPMLRARGGHGRRVPSWLGRGSDGHQLNRRVRSVRDDDLPRWQALGRARGSSSTKACSQGGSACTSCRSRRGRGHCGLPSLASAPWLLWSRASGPELRAVTLVRSVGRTLAPAWDRRPRVRRPSGRLSGEREATTSSRCSRCGATARSRGVRAPRLQSGPPPLLGRRERPRRPEGCRPGVGVTQQMPVLEQHPEGASDRVVGAVGDAAPLIPASWARPDSVARHPGPGHPGSEDDRRWREDCAAFVADGR
jgi:hypothetical protein